MGTLTLLADGNNADDTRVEAFFGTTGQIITGHDACVAFYANIQGFPSVVYADNAGAMHALYNPADMAAVAAWQSSIDNPPAPAPVKTLAKEDFLALFTDTELVQLKSLEDTDPTIGLFWEKYRGAESISLDDPRTIAAVTYICQTKGYVAASRQAQILAGQAPS